MKFIKIILIILCSLFLSQNLFGQKQKQKKYKLKTVYDSAYVAPKRPFLAAYEVFLLNVGVWAFDRYILDGDYAYISLSTMKQNLKTGFVWDNDSFSTNLLSHPYHGNLYFNAARSNGLSFWLSTPYALGGSLMWEMFMENEPASINDLVSTTIGGIALGEMTFRLSSLVLDDSKHGRQRVMRELFGAVISPIRALNRIHTGEMFRRYSKNSFDTEDIPFKVEISSGWRYLAKDNYPFKGDNSQFIKLGIEYGDPFANDNYEPFDYFKLNATLNIIGNQPLVASVNAMGMIWGQSFEPMPTHDMTVGVFQHFDFYQTSAISKSNTVPFEIAQTAAIGGGLLYKFPQIGNKINMEYGLHVNGILMGGALTDHFAINDRNYNMGSGFSIKFHSFLEFSKAASFSMQLEHYGIYTWKGYPNEPNPLPLDVDVKHLNAQGNKGSSQFTIINPKLEINISPKLSVGMDVFFYIRESQYKYFDIVNYRTFETRIGLNYKL